MLETGTKKYEKPVPTMHIESMRSANEENAKKD